MRVLLLWLALLAPAWAQSPPSPADRAAIAAVIQAQLGAFRRDDGPAAFAYAAPAIREIFATPDRFLAMVRTGYPPVYRPSSVEMAELTEEDGQWVQRVELVGPDGQPALALYSMERQPDGSWKIAGCALTVSPRLGA